MQPWKVEAGSDISVTHGEPTLVHVLLTETVAMEWTHNVTDSSYRNLGPEEHMPEQNFPNMNRGPWISYAGVSSPESKCSPGQLEQFFS